MKIGLHDSEKEHLRNKSFPNYALMKISAYHKSKGDIVEWWSPLEKYDRVYSSKIFDFTPENPYLPSDTNASCPGCQIHRRSKTVRFVYKAAPDGALPKA